MRLHEVTISQEIKSCCAATYGSHWARLLLGDSMHPGGLELTERLGRLLELTSGSHVLDVAAGWGVSALALARRFGCDVTGIDLSSACVESARHDANDSGLAGRASFEISDAECLPFGEGEFDAVICECAFCSFPDKDRAAAEMARVLKPGGRLGLSDLVLRGELPAELKTLAGWVACVADARRESDYISYLESAGFHQHAVETHDVALIKLVEQVRNRLFGATLLVRLGNLDLASVELDQAVGVAIEAESAIRRGVLGYILLTAVKRT